MKNFKKIVLYSIFLFSFQKLYCLGRHAAHVVGEAVKEVGKSLETASTRVSNGLMVASETLGIEATNVAAKALSEATTTAANGLMTASENVGLEAAKIGAETVNQCLPYAGAAIAVAGVAVGVYGVTQVVSIGKDLYDYNYPSEEQQARNRTAREITQFFKAKQELRDCLIKHGMAKSPRNDLGRPCACENFAGIFATVAGQTALDEMTANFKYGFPK